MHIAQDRENSIYSKRATIQTTCPLAPGQEETKTILYKNEAGLG